MGQLFHIVNGAFGLFEMVQITFSKIPLSLDELRLLAHFIERNKLCEFHRKSVLIDTAFTVSVIYYRARLPKFNMEIAAKQSHAWSRQIKEKIRRTLRDQWDRDVTDAEMRVITNFCIDRGFVLPEKRLSTQFIELGGFLAAYGYVRCGKASLHDACMQAATQYVGEKLLRLQKR